MVVHIIIFLTSLCTAPFQAYSPIFTTKPPVYADSYAEARQQSHQSSFSFTTMPSDNPIAQIRAAHRSRGYCHKKTNYHNTLVALVHTLNQQCYTPYHQKRCKALDKTHNNNKRVRRIMMINHDVALFAQKYDIAPRNLTHTKFNHYEHQLHKEFLEQLTHATELKHLYKQAPDYTFFIDAIGHGIALGVEANHNKQTVAATYWADVVWQAIDIAKAVGEGIGLGIYNTATFGAQIIKSAGSAVLHPIETIRAIARGIDAVLSFFTPDFEKPRRRVNLYQELDVLNERIAQVAHHCSEQLSHMSLHDKIKFTTAFATEIVAPAKIFKVAHRLCKRMRPLAVGLINSIREEQVTVEIAGIGKISDQKQILHLVHEAQAVENAVEKSVSQGAKVIDKIKRVLVPSWIDPKALTAKFEGRSIFNGRSVHVDYEHLFSIGEMSRVKRSGHICDAALYGWHHDYARKLESAGTVAYENIVQGVGGAFQANPIVNSSVYKAKTFFSPLWTEEHVIEKIFEVFDKTIHLVKDLPPDRSGCYTLIGKTIEDLEIKIIFDPIKNLITTAYPIV